MAHVWSMFFRCYYGYSVLSTDNLLRFFLSLFFFRLAMMIAPP